MESSLLTKDGDSWTSTAACWGNQCRSAIGGVLPARGHTQTANPFMTSNNATDRFDAGVGVDVGVATPKVH